MIGSKSDAPLGVINNIFFVWGLKRSGIHFLVEWLYANLGGRDKLPLVHDHRRHLQLQSGFHDPRSGVAFFNNCGYLNSRGFHIGGLRQDDFLTAASFHSMAIFGVEDADLACAGSVPPMPCACHILLLRDPLNTIASRLRGLEERPGVFPVNERFIDLYDQYCHEFVGATTLLKPQFKVVFNRMVLDRGYRDRLASNLGVANLDSVGTVSPYGGGSSFTGTEERPGREILKRFRQKAIPRQVLEQLLSKPTIGQVCKEQFEYDLEAMVNRCEKQGRP